MATVYSGGKRTALGTLPGATGSMAVGVSDNGDVTGTSGGDAFLYKNGVMENLGKVGTSTTSGYLINDDDQIAGTPLFLYSNGKLSPITDLSGAATITPSAMNSSAVIVGVEQVKIDKTIKTLTFISFRGSRGDLKPSNRDLLSASYVLDSTGPVGRPCTGLSVKSGWVVCCAAGFLRRSRPTHT